MIAIILLAIFIAVLSSVWGHAPIHPVCWILGHRWRSNNWNWYEDCERCGMDERMLEFYETWPELGLMIDSRCRHAFVNWVLFPIHRLRVLLFSRCFACGKLERVLFWKVGNHPNCDIPF